MTTSNDDAASRRAVLISGAGTGVGAATATLLAGKGWDVLVNYRRSRVEAEAVVEACRARGATAIAVAGDVAVDGDCRALVDAAVRQFGRLDAVVCSAGTTMFVPLHELDGVQAEDFARVFQVNAVGPFQLARAAAPHLRASGSGAVVNVSSVASQTGSGSSVAYVASKAALNAITLSLARALAPEIRVNAVLPGMIEGRWLSDGLGEDTYQRVKAEWAQGAALGRVATPADIAVIIAFLIDEANVVTGQLVTADCGVQLGRPVRVS